jgi:hypothetical protein
MASNERILEHIATSLSEMARATVQMSNSLVRIEKALNEKESDGQEGGGDALPGL